LLIALLRQVGQHEDRLHHLIFIPALDALFNPFQLVLNEHNPFVLFPALR